MEKPTLSADIFNGQEHYRFTGADLSDYNTAFPDSLISFMYMNVTSANSAMDSFEQMVGRLFTEKDTEVLTKCSYAAELYLESLTSLSIYFLPLELEYKPLLKKLRETQFSDYARQRISLTKIKTARRKTSLMQEQLLRLADGVFDADSSSESNLERLTTYYQVNTRRHLPYKFLPLTTTYELVDDKYFTEVLKQKMVLYLCDKEGLELIDPDPDRYEIIADRRYYDYIYDAKKMMTYSGKAYHKKKNHVNAFLREYGDRWEYRSLDRCSHMEEIMEFLHRWEVKRDIKDPYNRVDYELDGIEYLLAHCGQIHFQMGGIYIDGQLEAFSLGVYGHAERTAYIHVEKANPNIRGLYPFISQQFLLHEFPDALYVNREDDMGLEGLRKSKMSYNPILLEEKYEIRQK